MQVKHDYRLGICVAENSSTLKGKIIHKKKIVVKIVKFFFTER